VKVSTAFVLSLAVTLSGVPLFAAEGVLIVQKNTIGTRIRTGHIQIEKERMRTEIESPTGQKQIMMFDAPKQVLTIVNVDQKSYTEFTSADAGQIGLRASPALQEQMAKMPPEQRAVMEAMIRGRAAAPPVKLEYRKAGSDKVGKWTCDKYEGYQNNVKRMEICTVPAKTIGVAPGDLDVAKQMAAFFAKIAPGSQAGAPTLEVGTPETLGFSGMPVRTVGFGNKGEVIYTSEVVDITRQNFPATSYEVPAGFQKQAPFAGRGGTPSRGGTP
jgi:hypothetical protein